MWHMSVSRHREQAPQAPMTLTPRPGATLSGQIGQYGSPLDTAPATSRRSTPERDAQPDTQVRGRRQRSPGEQRSPRLEGTSGRSTGNDDLVLLRRSEVQEMIFKEIERDRSVRDNRIEEKIDNLIRDYERSRSQQTRGRTVSARTTRTASQCTQFGSQPRC